MAKRTPFRHQNKPKVLVKIRLKKDDKVKVIAGKDKGKTGRILDVNRVTGRITVEGVGMVKRHTKPNPNKQIKGGIAERESAIQASNVMILTAAGDTTRISYKMEGPKRVRIARKGGETLDKK
jgi:large subunit ribosomal protein L24